MSFASLTTSDLKILGKLIQKKDALRRRIAALNDRIEAIEEKPSTRRPRRRRSRRSATVRKKMAAAQRKRRAAERGSAK